MIHDANLEQWEVEKIQIQLVAIAFCVIWTPRTVEERKFPLSWEWRTSSSVQDLWIFYNFLQLSPPSISTWGCCVKGVVLLGAVDWFSTWGRCTSLFLLASNATTKDLWTSTWASLPRSSIWKVRSCCWSCWKWVGIREVNRGPLNGSQLFVVKLQEGGSCHQHCRNVHHNWWHRLCGRSGLCQAKGWNSPCHLTCFTKRSIKPRYMRFSWCFQFSVYRI